MAYRIIEAVTDEPVSLTEARLQCKVDDDDDTHDAALTALIVTAREYAEHYTGRAAAPQTIEMALDCFPEYENDVIYLDMPPVTSIVSVKYTDTAGVEQTISPSAYALSPYGEARKLAPTFGNYWPSTQDIPDAVRIRYVCGPESTPKTVKQAILLHIEIESPLNALTPAERETLEKARDSLLNVTRVYG